MTRIQWSGTLLAAVFVTACGTDGSASAEREPEPATDWTMPTGVFRNDKPSAGLLELHVDQGSFRLYDITDGSPDLGYAATCVTDDPSTVTCTGSDGFRIVFAWSGTDDAIELTLPSGEANDRAVFEGATWTRVP